MTLPISKFISVAPFVFFVSLHLYYKRNRAKNQCTVDWCGVNCLLNLQHPRMLTHHPLARVGHGKQKLPNAIRSCGERERTRDRLSEICGIGRLCDDGDLRRFADMRKDLSSRLVCRKDGGIEDLIKIFFFHADGGIQHPSADARTGIKLRFGKREKFFGIFGGFGGFYHAKRKL